MPGPSAQARGGDACFKPPKASAWEKGRLSFTRFPSLRPCARAPQRRWKEIRQHPPHPPICGPSRPGPTPHSLAQAGTPTTGGLQERKQDQRGEAPCPGPLSPGVKELKSRL